LLGGAQLGHEGLLVGGWQRRRSEGEERPHLLQRTLERRDVRSLLAEFIPVSSFEGASLPISVELRVARVARTG
jgi:hypothetical protein